MIGVDGLISEQEFTDDWQPMLQPSGDLFQFADVCVKPLQHIWTIVDSGDDSDGNWYACPGFHVVNMLGYVVTKKAWSNDTWDAIYFLDDIN